MVASEVAPYAKTGGLADVIGSLPMALRERGCDVRVVMPHYSAIDARRFPSQIVARIHFPFDKSDAAAEIKRFGSPGEAASRLEVSPVPMEVPVYSIEAPRYFRREKIYGYADDILRFGFFCRACLELPRALDWQPDIIHCHDWHAGLLPVYLRALRSNPNLGLSDARTIFSIHNLAYQGLAAHEYLEHLDLDPALWNMHQLEYHGRISPMKGGLVFSDALTTVSPRYAREIQTSYFGEGLDGVLRERALHSPSDLRGILNGIDSSHWNPRDDTHIAAHYDATDIRNKQICKRDLLRRAALETSPRPFLKPVPHAQQNDVPRTSARQAATTSRQSGASRTDAAPVFKTGANTSDAEAATQSIATDENRQANASREAQASQAQASEAQVAQVRKTQGARATTLKANRVAESNGVDEAIAIEEAPLIGMVSRLSSQKGFDLIVEAMPEIVALGCRFVLLGDGDEKYLKLLGALGNRFSRDISMNLGRFNDDLAHRIYAGSDLFLMPSLYEPCGLGQMLALGYGTIPIVRETGGLADTVTEYDPARNVGNGFVFHDASVPAMLEALKRALHCYRSNAWPRLIRNALDCDFSWNTSAARYEELYREVKAR